MMFKLAPGCLLSAMLFLHACSPPQVPDSNAFELETYTAKYEVSYHHKGSKDDAPVKSILFEMQSLADLNRVQSVFYTDVRSVFCGENVCKMDPVRLYWNELGQFLKYELRNNVTLEKGNAEPFETQDYDKLSKILANPNSGLQHLYKEELIKPRLGGNTVDALSGATVTIQNDDNIKGAIWTCYTLWHFANGELPQIIRNIKGDNLSEDELLSVLTKPELEYKLYALEQLTRKRLATKTAYRAASTQAVITQASDSKAVSKIYEAVLNYLNQLPVKNYSDAIEQLFMANNRQLDAAIAKSLLETQYTLTDSLNYMISRRIENSQYYQNTLLFLQVLEEQSMLSEHIYLNLLAGLNNDDFLSARAIYWFLLEQNLAQPYAAVLRDFEKDNGHKL